MLTIVPFRRVDAFAGQATVPESLDLERLFRQRLARRPGTNDDRQVTLVIGSPNEDQQPDPPFMAVCTAYATTHHSCRSFTRNRAGQPSTTRSSPPGSADRLLGDLLRPVAADRRR